MLATLTDDEAQLAACTRADPDLCFPDKGQRSSWAKKVCGECDVRSRCLEIALINEEEFGVWGGLDERERRRLNRKGRNGLS